MFIKNKKTIEIEEIKEIKNKIDSIEKSIDALNTNLNDSYKYYQSIISKKENDLKLVKDELELEKKSSRIYKSKAGGYSTSAKKSQLKIDELEEKLKQIAINHEEQINKLNDEILMRDKKIKNLSKDNNHLLKENEKYKNEKKEFNEMIKKLNNEIHRLNAKPKTTPTINELEKDKLFHGKRN